MLYTIQVKDRNYTTIIPCDINLPKKIFHGDIYDTEKNKIVKSPLKENKTITGVLILENNQTYGRTKNKKRLFYKCIPEYKHYPVFLVPYEVNLGFSKKVKNKYILFQYDNWDEDHPHGVITEVLGEVDNLEAFYEYQIYYRGLKTPNISFYKKTQELFHSIPEIILYSKIDEKIMKDTSYKIVDRTHHNIFSIDPAGSLDLDDAIGLTKNLNGGYTISIYIANVFVWLHTFNLWLYLTNQISTIYLPDKNRPLLPNILSNKLCSLLENYTRYAFYMDVHFDDKFSVISNEYGICKINVRKNYVYEEKSLLENLDYMKIMEITKHKADVYNSHDLVEYWMLYMNSQCGIELFKQKKGIFRITEGNYVSNEFDNNNNSFDKKTRMLLETWKKISGKYVNSKSETFHHSLLNVYNYCHITSPIRRLVDIINQTQFCKNMLHIKSFTIDGFLELWDNRIDYINDCFKKIRKTQLVCEMIKKCHDSVDIMERPQSAYVIEKEKLENGRWRNVLYFKEWNIIATSKTEEELELNKPRMFRIYYFGEEMNINKRIRISLVAEPN